MYCHEQKKCRYSFIYAHFTVRVPGACSFQHFNWGAPRAAPLLGLSSACCCSQLSSAETRHPRRVLSATRAPEQTCEQRPAALRPWVPAPGASISRTRSGHAAVSMSDIPVPLLTKFLYKATSSRAATCSPRSALASPRPSLGRDADGGRQRRASRLLAYAASSAAT